MLWIAFTWLASDQPMKWSMDHVLTGVVWVPWLKKANCYISVFHIQHCSIFSCCVGWGRKTKKVYLDLVSCLMEPTGTGQVNVTCPVGSTLSWSAEFKHRKISAHAVHIWGDWQHLKGHWVKPKISSWDIVMITLCLRQWNILTFKTDYQIIKAKGNYKIRWDIQLRFCQEASQWRWYNFWTW
jgi:hypothetical protein